ncbi:MAG TPA: antibiotic biosynthesis monooxygenase [Rhizomicrobium sp.]|nr:antibiotic biosynthesis monooxygenase [Rhizomicrobium sp.]
MFLVLYRWHVKPGYEDQFREAWRRGTHAITRRYHSYGSRLCRQADGAFVGAAEWPDEAAWRAAMAQHMAHDDLEADQKFNEAIEDGGAPLLTLTILDDLLQRPGRSPGLTGPEFPFDV